MNKDKIRKKGDGSYKREEKRKKKQHTIYKKKKKKKKIESVNFLENYSCNTTHKIKERGVHLHALDEPSDLRVLVQIFHCGSILIHNIN